MAFAEDLFEVTAHHTDEGDLVGATSVFESLSPAAGLGLDLFAVEISALDATATMDLVLIIGIVRDTVLTNLQFLLAGRTNTDNRWRVELPERAYIRGDVDEPITVLLTSTTAAQTLGDVQFVIYHRPYRTGVY
jgi:hypothetical protein